MRNGIFGAILLGVTRGDDEFGLELGCEEEYDEEKLEILVVSQRDEVGEGGEGEKGEHDGKVLKRHASSWALWMRNSVMRDHLNIKKSTLDGFSPTRSLVFLEISRETAIYCPRSCHEI